MTGLKVGVGATGGSTDTGLEKGGGTELGAGTTGVGLGVATTVLTSPLISRSTAPAGQLPATYLGQLESMRDSPLRSGKDLRTVSIARRHQLYLTIKIEGGNIREATV